jgi:hypothetical protein
MPFWSSNCLGTFEHERETAQQEAKRERTPGEANNIKVSQTASASDESYRTSQDRLRATRTKEVAAGYLCTHSSA